jgi:hypothetical protein
MRFDAPALDSAMEVLQAPLFASPAKPHFLNHRKISVILAAA